MTATLVTKKNTFIFRCYVFISYFGPLLKGRRGIVLFCQWKKEDTLSLRSRCLQLVEEILLRSQLLNFSVLFQFTVQNLYLESNVIL